MPAKETRVLIDLKRVVEDSGIDESLVEYGATYNPDTDEINYYIKLKNHEDYILNTTTHYDMIPYDISKPLTKILRNINITLPYGEYVDVYAIKNYTCPETSITLPCIYMEDSNIILLPSVDKLMLIKKVRISAGLTSKEMKLVYNKDVTPENFLTVLNELKELYSKPSKDLLTVVDI